MKEYIKNLTNQIIGDNNLGVLYDQVHSALDEEQAKAKFIAIACASIHENNVCYMLSDALGRAFCSLRKADYCEEGKVFNIEGGFHDPASIARKNLPVLLARAVYYRFRAGEGNYHHTEPYFSPKAMERIERSGAKKIVDQLVARRNARN
jgi:hypothetical protein